MIRFFDMFAGVGGFRAGLERVGGYECVGHCEIDKHADKAYQRVHNVKESEIFYDDAKTIDTEKMPDFDLLCAGFPCQAFSIAGRRKGFTDPRGTLFFEIARILRAKRPAYVLLENVLGLLCHDKGRTFATILDTLCDIGYCCSWAVCNSKDYGVPQSRRRVYIIGVRFDGHIGAKCPREIFSVRNANSKTVVQGRNRLCFIDLCKVKPKITENARCLTARYDRGISNRQSESSGVLLIKEATKIGYKKAVAGDSVNLSYANQNQKRGRVGKAIANTLDTSNQQGVVVSADSATASDCSALPRIRRLMPRECFRLQGFTDEQIDKLLENSSDTQAYKQAGNAVTVNVVCAIGERLREFDTAL